MRKISQESLSDDIEEKMHEIKKTIGETVGEELGVFELNTVGVMLTGKSSLRAIKVVFSLAVFHHINVVIFSRAKKSLEDKVDNKANDLGLSYQLKAAEEVSGVDLLVVSSKREIPRGADIPILQVI